MEWQKSEGMRILRHSSRLSQSLDEGGLPPALEAKAGLHQAAPPGPASTNNPESHAPGIPGNSAIAWETTGGNHRLPRDRGLRKGARIASQRRTMASPRTHRLRLWPTVPPAARPPATKARRPKVIDHGIIVERESDAIMAALSALGVPTPFLTSPTNFVFELSAIISFNLRESYAVPFMQKPGGHSLLSEKCTTPPHIRCLSFSFSEFATVQNIRLLRRFARSCTPLRNAPPPLPPLPPHRQLRRHRRQ